MFDGKIGLVKEKMKIIFLIIAKVLFFVSGIVAVGIDGYYKFDIEMGVKGYYLALFSYLYFCFCLAILLIRQILKIHNRLIKFILYLLLWPICILIIYLDDLIKDGILSTIEFVVFLVMFFAGILLTFYLFNKFIIKKRKGFLFKIFKSLSIGIILVLLVWTILLFSVTNTEEKNDVDEKTENNSVPVILVQPWQLNSRYKINAVIKFIKVDLDSDGKEEIAAITSYNKIPNDVFYYAGFYRFNPVTEMWDEFYSEDLNILNYSTAKNEVEPSKLIDFVEKFVKMWSTEFTTLENIGDITGDGSPEIVFSSLLQGKYYENYIIVAQGGKSHYRYKIFQDQNTWAKIVVEDGMLIEKYYDEDNDIKEIYEWDKVKLYFRLIETQKTKSVIPDTPQISPEIEKITG